MLMKQKILPSIMAKDQEELDADFKKLEGLVKELHLDVVDGKFAPNEAMNFEFRLSRKFRYNIHLMVKNPEQWISKYLRRIDLFIPQIEEIKDIPNYISWMKDKGKRIGFALKPETKVKILEPYLVDIDYILVLTVKPGFYGSKYLPRNLSKVKQIKKTYPKIKVIVDGGISPETIGEAAKAGADYFVSGSYVTKADNPKQRIQNLMTAMKK
tara:strand:+ start:1137 stop:1772 length:636 start_codon:yes stop_codon:yes gene_type:complete